MDAIKLAAIFTLIICLMKMKRPLSFSIICGIAAACVLFGIGINDAAKAIFESITSWDTLSLILIFYLIAFLQRMLEKRDFLNLAHRSLNGLFNSRRINASLAPAFIGLLPSAGAVFERRGPDFYYQLLPAYCRKLFTHIFFYCHRHPIELGTGFLIPFRHVSHDGGTDGLGVHILPQKTAQGNRYGAFNQ